jgi:hypothetical protein
VTLATLAGLTVKGLFGGGLVVAFALVAEALRPKSFAGLFGAAPSIAIAGLAVTLVIDGARKARLESLGMVLGSAAFVVCSLVAAALLARGSAMKASLVSWGAWLLAASGLYAAFLR